MSSFERRSSQERLQDGIDRLRRWLKEDSPIESAPQIESEIAMALAEERARSRTDLTEMEGEITRLQEQVRIREANRAVNDVPKDNSESGPEKRDNQEGKLPK